LPFVTLMSDMLLYWLTKLLYALGLVEAKVLISAELLVDDPVLGTKDLLDKATNWFCAFDALANSIPEIVRTLKNIFFINFVVEWCCLKKLKRGGCKGFEGRGCVRYLVHCCMHIFCRTDENDGNRMEKKSKKEKVKIQELETLLFEFLLFTFDLFGFSCFSNFLVVCL